MTLRTLSYLALTATLLAACGDGKSFYPDPGDTDPGADASDTGDSDASEDAGPTPEEEQEAILNIGETEAWTLPTLQGDVHVVRVEANIPHIFAENERDAAVVQGFLMGRDRYFQFELASRLARGRVSELLGDLGLALDQDSRGRGNHVIAQRLLDGLSPEQQDLFDAFAEGVNAYISEAQAGNLPVPTEFVTVAPLVGFPDPAQIMAPADRESVAGFASFLVYQLGYEPIDVLNDAVSEQIVGHFDGAEFAELRQAGLEEDIWGAVRPVISISSGDGFRTEGAQEKEVAAGFGRPFVPSLGLPTSMRSRIIEQAVQDLRLLRRGTDGDSGSNGWAVGGDRVAGGGGLLANDGHLPLGVAPFFYQMGINTRVFGGGDRQVVGLFFPGIPTMGVGTNGDVAWGQTYLYGDVTDWYREEIQLGDDGLPAASYFDEEWRDLVRYDEVYSIAAVLGGQARDETWPRWEIFDGRWLVDIEGRVLDGPDDAEEGESVVNMRGTYIAVGDTDDDGVITGLSFDFTGFDVADTIGTIDGFSRSANVEELRERTRGLVAYAQNVIAADREGGVLYTGFNGAPCRRYLDREANGSYAPGADPTRLLDGTRYGGFTIPVDDDQQVISDADDPYRCTIAFDEWPQSLNPERGYVITANNDPAGITFDNDATNDLYHFGGPWAPGYRADTIDQGIVAEIEAGGVSVEGTSALQGEHRSRVGEDIFPHLEAAVLAAQSASSGADGAEGRLAGIYASNPDAVDEALERMQAWRDRGYDAASGVETFYNAPTEESRADAVATMIFNQFFRELYAGMFSDEGIDFVFAPDPRGSVMRSIYYFLEARGEEDTVGLSSWNRETGESIFFDVLGTEPVETSEEILVQALVDAIATLSGPGRADTGGFGTEDMDAWLWGLRHQVVFESVLVGFAPDDPIVGLLANDFSINTSRLPLDGGIDSDDPRDGLTWFPRPGDFFSVDAANPSFTGDDYFYTNGPVMRMVIHMTEDGVRGVNILPGGQSGVLESEHFADQAELWLGNETLPFRYEVADIVVGAVGRERYTP